LGEIVDGPILPRYKVGDKVRVREETRGSRWRKPHLRVPGYLFGQQGVIERYCGDFADPEFLAFRGFLFTSYLDSPSSSLLHLTYIGEAAKMPLYNVAFSQVPLTSLEQECYRLVGGSLGLLRPQHR